MTVSLEEALDQLNITDSETDLEEVQLYVDAANEWVATKVTDTTPAPVRLATLFLVDHLWESQRGPAAVPFGEEDLVVASRGYAVPNRVRQLLEPYLAATSRNVPTYSFPDAVAWADPVEWPA